MSRILCVLLWANDNAHDSTVGLGAVLRPDTRFSPFRLEDDLVKTRRNRATYTALRSAILAISLTKLEDA